MIHLAQIGQKSLLNLHEFASQSRHLHISRVNSRRHLLLVTGHAGDILPRREQLSEGKELEEDRSHVKSSGGEGKEERGCSLFCLSTQKLRLTHKGISMRIKE